MQSVCWRVRAFGLIDARYPSKVRRIWEYPLDSHPLVAITYTPARRFGEFGSCWMSLSVVEDLRDPALLGLPGAPVCTENTPRAPLM